MAIMILLIQCVLFHVVVVGATEVESKFTRSTIEDSFTNMAFYEGIIYIGAKNSIYVLNATNLTEVHMVRTCTGECNNVNKVLVVNKILDHLITCGTGNEGSCKIRTLTTISDVLGTSMTGDGQQADYLVVSTNKKRPSAFVLTENGVYVGVTYGSGVKTGSAVSIKNTYFNLLSYYSLVDSKFASMKSLQVKLGNGMNVNFEDYLIYFKAGFELDGFVYFVTNQKFKVGDGEYTSKLIRLCQNDKAFYSYTDIKLECENHGIEYNLIQDVSVFEPGEDLRKHFNATGKIMAATFASGSNPESPTSPSAICLYKLEDINHNIMQAKRNFIRCSAERLREEERYLSDNRPAVCFNSSQYNETTFACNRDFQPYTYITGDENSSLSASAIFTTSSSDISGYFNKIQTSTLGNYTILHTGTSNGWLIKLNANTAQADVFDKKAVDEGHPITGLHVEPGGKKEYVMSDRKIVRYEITACNYATCEATMEARNPLCGWCVYDNKSTFKENSTCPYQSYHGHWLSSLTECLTLDVHPKGVPVGTTVNVIVDINIPQTLTGDTYECKFTNGSDHSNPVATQISDGNSFRCDSGSTAAHSEGKLEFYVNHSSTNIFLAETDFLFFDCRHYNKCGDCTGDSRANCSWDSLDTRCIAKNSTYSWLIQKMTNCPKFQRDTVKHYIPSGIAKKLTFNVSNLVNSSDTRYYCRLNDSVVEAVKENDNTISCTLMVSAGSDKESEQIIQIIYGITRNSTFDGENKVVVYSCEKLGTDCSICRSLEYTNSAYECEWCSGSCIYPTVNASCDDKCSPPNITRVVPNTAGTEGNITVTVYGQELGSRFEEVNNISLAGVPCKPQPQNYRPSTRVTCSAGQEDRPVSESVVMFVNNMRSTGEVSFSYKANVKLFVKDISGTIKVTSLNFGVLYNGDDFYCIPQLMEVIPKRGPQAGGTRLTITGNDLGIGTRQIEGIYVQSVVPQSDAQEGKNCVNAKVMPDFGLLVEVNTSSFWIECDTPSAVVGEMLESMEIIFEGGTILKKNINFTYLENPEIGGMDPLKGIASGGNLLTITGKKLDNSHKGYVSGMSGELPCKVNSGTEMICPVPKLTVNQRADLKWSRKKRETNSGARISVTIIIHLDGVRRSFSIDYFSDPSFEYFEEVDQVKLFESDQRELTIKGENLNLVAKRDDVNVTVGVDICGVLELNENSLTCLAPTSQPASSVAGASLPEVNVSIGNVQATVGYLRYVEIQKELAKVWIIIAAVIGGLLAIVVIVAVALLLKNRQKSKKMRTLQRHMEEQEMEIKDIFREEFADMHTSMLVVNNSLIEQGCPYHHYQKYTFNVMFPADNIDSHPLLQEPVVSTEVTDMMRSKMKRGMEEFESLIFNKYFLLSVINSLENQRKFGLKDKANLCGYICTILLGRMEYLQEILVDLLGNLVQESTGKKNQKVLFRRCETITEKLLSNWLSLCLYPHLKSQSGWPLYLLYKATQLHMEAGPIDAITNDAKYTLSEDKLLKKYSQHSKQGSDEPTFEAKCLTLNVVVDNCRDIKICRVLDCDTITQVKEKCLTQIYVNYPASNLSVTSEELELEWHAGMSGSLRLRDVDNTSKRLRSWVRLNTLAHYNVKDESNMALIDPQVADDPQNQDYANLAQVSLTCPSESSIDSTDVATAALVMEQGDSNVKYWHIVKPEESTLAAGKSQIPTELYLNRLLTFKQSILEYVRAIYDTVLKADILPPHIHYLYNLLDDLAEKNKVEADILHAWKSMSYPVRIWATLMKKPSNVFDIKSPPYVDTSMDVISQVFIECFSLETHKLSKDSPTHKLIFSNEMTQYKEKVKQFYRNISVMESQPDSHRKYLEEVNKLQQQHTSFNKMSALHKLFEQIQPYMEEVIDDLSNNRDACKLHLDKKLEQISGLMEED